MSRIQDSHNPAAAAALDGPDDLTGVFTEPTDDTASQTDAGPSTGLVLLLATGAGFSVASLYYSQPILGILGPETGAGAQAVGMLPMLAQLGYALGILLLTPLGDRFDRRRIILLKGALLTATLVFSGLAPGIETLLAASLMIGLTATVAQDIVPSAAALAPDHHRGRIVGRVMTGLLLGILLSRVVSGVVAEQFGWRVVYLAAAATMALFCVAAWKGLPRFAPTTTMGYGGLMGSMAELWMRHRPLRRAAVAQGLLAMAFSAFWSTLAIMLHTDFGMGAAVAGSFGLAGAAGALAAPLAGSLSDKRGPEMVTRLGAALAAVSFAAMALMPLLPQDGRLVLLVLSAIGFDFGMQATLIAHQTIVFGVEPPARSRLNALLFTGMFIGMASGAGLGSLALAHWQWQGVVVLTSLAALAALAVRMLPGGRR